MLQYAGVDFGRRAYDTNYNNLGPRAGFAWDVIGDGRTVVRAGYGIFYYHSADFEYPDTQGFSVATPFQSPRGHGFPRFPAVRRAGADHPAVRKFAGAEQFSGQQRDLLRERSPNADRAAMEPDRSA